jgi:DsbC/DsbD-like thiol-disulfide interchange protein
MFSRPLKLLAGVLLLSGVTGACSSGSADGPRRTGPAVVASVQARAAADQRIRLTWRFDLAADWHLYWPGLNDSGFPPSVELSLPEGWRAEPLRWPVPTRHVLPGEILDHVLTGPQVVLEQTLVTAGAPGDTVRAKLRWLACRDACVPGDTTLVLVLDGEPEPLVDEAADQRYPGALPADGFDFALHDQTLVVTAPGAAALRFFPYENCGPFVDLLHDGEAAGEHLRLRLKTREGGVGPVRGLLQIERPDGTLLTGPVEL